tara:strand:- start:1354 stop:1512 length:159 start_codon:yes stop_codon:yes gene_type:complete
MYQCKSDYPDHLRREPRGDVYYKTPPKKNKPLQPTEVFEGYKGKKTTKKEKK